ncbi:MAG: SagB/ThcOx family dehydrogenase [Chloroflexi bacterium]|jgi:SagB-type dehydrogenase family enzyme|nr:SagB/ThcOx family dehydrogenase [Chloroflexota bacterium]
MSDLIGPIFMRQTQYDQQPDSAQSQGLPQPPVELPYDITQRPVELPAPESLAVPPVDLRELIEQRATLRRYADAPLSLAELSYLLWCTQGIKPGSRAERTSRTVPSAGARHAFETLVLANRVTDLAPGLYRFVASLHQLVAQTLDADIAADITHACLDQAQIAHSAVTLIWVAVAERMVYRYSQRGYRYLHLDAGHVCQNLYLAAESIGCGVCAIAAFDDQALNDALALDGESQFAIYLGTVGKRP